ncbi:DMT family transporter [Caenimonas soli]|uniref:DMT family transporter n=1 Tax=Caenimonas soli TaxID=2735555 RepID=UPI00155277B8|nr:DMT family transporter [Caenimonas soli]NPC56398.1 DMT family transporter [Caenimonas soli]
MSELPRRAQGGALAVALVLLVIWGTNFSIIKLVMSHTSPGAFLFARYIVTPLCAVLLLLFVYGTRWPRLPREEWRTLAWLTLLGHVLHVTLINWGIYLSSPFSTALIVACGPLMTLIILAVAGSERLGRAQVAGAVIACAGILVFLADKIGLGWQAGFGDLVLLAATLLFSLHTVAARDIIIRRGPLLVMTYTTIMAFPPLMLLTGLSGVATDWTAIPPMVLLGLAWALVVSSFAGWILWGWVNQLLGVARTAPLLYLLPPVAGVAGWLMTGETFPSLKLAGAALALLGVALAQFGRTPA